MIELPVWIPILSSALVFIAIVLGLGPLGKIWDMFSNLYTRDLLKLLAILEINEDRFNFFMRVWGIVLVGNLFLMLFVFRLPLLAVAVTIIIVAFPPYLDGNQS